MKRKLALLLLGAMLLFGCGTSSPARFYTLSPLASAAAPIPASTQMKGAVIGVGPVAVPDRLDRPQLVSLSGENELIVADFDRWSGSFREEITRTVTENLAALLPTYQVVSYSWGRRLILDKQITIDIIRIDGIRGRHVTLKANWAILGNNGMKTILVKHTEFAEKITGPSYEDYAAAQSRALDILSREIAAAIAALPEETGKEEKEAE